MQVTKRDGTVEKQIITGMVVSDRVLGRLAPKWKKEGLFRSPWCNLIGNWCVKYYAKYNKAPRKMIVGLFESWAQTHGDRESVKLVEKFLSVISGEYQSLRKSLNAEYIVDLAGGHFNETALRMLNRAVEGDLSQGKVSEALNRISRFGAVDVGAGRGINPLSDLASIKEVLDDKNDVLFRYDGPMGQFFGNSLERDGFLSFMGPEKSGKTWWLLDMAWRAMLSGVPVAFFEVGDLSKKQIMRRFYTRACKRPLRKPRAYRTIHVPTRLEVISEGQYDIGEKALKITEDMTERDIQRVCRNIGTKIGDPNLLTVSIHPNSSISVQGIRHVLEEWQNTSRRKQPPGLVVIDYADIIATSPGFKGESRDGVNETWKALRRMSQELHCLVVTATQANSQAYKADQLGMEHFSEDKRKFAHVTGMIGINQSSSDKEKGISRLNWLVLREDEFISSRECYAAGCLGIANPCIFSQMR